MCKDGYKSKQTSTVNTCTPYVVINCLYYAADECIQSTKVLAVNFNIIYGLNQSYDIPQASCNQQASTIAHCQYYLPNLIIDSKSFS